MDRFFESYLKQRSVRTKHVPLLVRGARQVGKSYSIRNFGKTEFKDLLEVNLELSPQLIPAFKSRHADTIVRELELLSNVRVFDRKTLLFIDEIHESVDAILSLRAFKEQRPDLDVIAAGSLLEFALDETKLRSFPVGRVAFSWMHPMSFKEFLMAKGEDLLIDLINSVSIHSKMISAPVHLRLLGLVREYFIVGGMPEVLDVYCESKSFIEARIVQTRLTTGYIADFAKYGASYDHRKLQELISAVPRLVGKKFKFSHVDSLARARDLKKPLIDLQRAGLVHLVQATSANGVPLASEEKEDVFKVQFLDIGLMLNLLGLDLGALGFEDALFANEGALAEQFVGQELIANNRSDVSPRLHYWHREAKGAEAEVDFVIAYEDKVVPVEVKAGRTGRLKSVNIFSKEKNSKLAIRVSQHELSLHDRLLSIPFYLCSELGRLTGESFR